MSLQVENSNKQEVIDNLRFRHKQSTDTILLDVENENKKLMDSNLQLQSQVTLFNCLNSHLGVFEKILLSHYFMFKFPCQMIQHSLALVFIEDPIIIPRNILEHWKQKFSFFFDFTLSFLYV